MANPEIPETIYLGYDPKEGRKVPPRELLISVHRNELHRLRMIMDTKLCDELDTLERVLDEIRLRGPVTLPGGQKVRVDWGSLGILTAIVTRQLTPLQVTELINKRLEEVT
ncbi:hypothetical protein ISS42_00820 [Candidatus Shapirobacteria bacterium]|nr:hypothetical protein [Candidatus Shapirobacteria bacterium]